MILRSEFFDQTIMGDDMGYKVLRSFVNKSTSSIGKTTSEAYQDKVIGPMLRRLNKQGERHCAILCGNIDGLMRHIIRMRKLGFPDKNIVIFEINAPTAAKLKRSVQLRKLKCQVIQGDLIAGVEKLSNAGYSFGYVEFDGIEKFGESEPKVYSLVKSLDIPVLVTQGAARGQTKEFKDYMRQKGHRMSWCNHNKRLSFSLLEKAPIFVKNKLTGYANWFKTYGGADGFPMYMSISIAKGV